MEENDRRQPFKDDHIFRLTDDTGMLQHAKYAIPDPRYGYTTDDNARALIMALMLFERYRKKRYLDLVYRYASFLLGAQNDEGGFRNFMGYDRNWLEEEGSEDCFGRCLWAIGFALSGKHTPDGVKNGLSCLLRRALPRAGALRWPRAKAYTIIGLACLKGDEYKRLIRELADSLCSLYEASSGEGWRWFENTVTYCNSVLPWSLIDAYRISEDKRYLQVAQESLAFLESIVLANDCFKPVGCHGWYPRGGKPAAFDEQPVEACEAVFAYTAFHAATGDRAYLEKARICHAWYTGRNSMKLSLIDSETGGCYDGLTPKGVNLNMGAESLVSYVMSLMRIEEVMGKTAHP